ncbi:MAG: hypothetical protein AB1716_21300, partial [Planctomycetota bacterium]
AEGRLAARLAEHRAAGRPTRLEDYARAPIPDSENAAYYLQLAASKLVTPPNVRVTADDLTGQFRDLGDYRRDLDQIVAANAEALALVRTARGKTEADWRLRLDDPTALSTQAVNVTSSQRALANFLQVAAWHQHLTGNDAAAVETFLDGMATSASLDHMRPFGVFWLLSTDAMEETSLRLLEPLAGELTIASVDWTGSPGGRPATRTQVEQVITYLLDESRFRQRWRAAFDAECELQATALEMLVEGTGWSGIYWARGIPYIGDRVQLALLLPAYRQDVLRCMDELVTASAAGMLETWQAVYARLPREKSLPSSAALGRPFSAEPAGSFERIGRGYFLVLAERRMSALALAIRLFKIDHGHRPERLAELVPDYLPALPRDPFDPTMGALRYLPDAPSPILYSVSRNATDDGGAWSSADPWASFDLPFFLNGDRQSWQRILEWGPAGTQQAGTPAPPTSAASTVTSAKAVPNDEQIEDAGGEEQEQPDGSHDQRGHEH